MALIVYPTTGYDTFATVAEADTAIEEYTLWYGEWGILSTAVKETYLRIAFRIIVDGIDDDDMPTTATDCLVQAQSLMAVQDFHYNLSNPSLVTNTTKKEKAGPVEIEYFEGKEKNHSRIPAMAMPCLEALNFVIPFSATGLARAKLVRS